MPNIPAPPNLQDDPRFAGALDLNDLRAKADAEKAEREAAALVAAEDYAHRWNKSMRRTFKGIVGNDGLSRRFRMRAALKKMERENA